MRDPDKLIMSFNRSVVISSGDFEDRVTLCAYGVLKLVISNACSYMSSNLATTLTMIINKGRDTGNRRHGRYTN